MAQAANVTLNVVDKDGNPVTGFRYLVQEDKTFAVDPANPAIDPDGLLSLGFHASNHPPAIASDGTPLSGNDDASSVSIPNVDPGRYYVSVLPYSGYSIGGNKVEVDAVGDATVTVAVQKQPIPTAQIAIYLFHDNFPINGAPDLPEELNPAAGQPGHVDWTQFSLFLEEPAGRYGQNGGQVIQDAFANPLGTTYVKGCDADGAPDVDPFTDYGCLDASGAPIVDVMGDGTLTPDSQGYLIVENLAPGKYGVKILPPSSDPGWQQTTTIEGTKVIDAWVKANEPPVFVEFGLPGPHVFMGFVRSTADGGFPPLQPPQAGQQVATVSGTITDMHMSRSPNFQFFSGRPFPQCWVGLNESTLGGLGAGLYAAQCDGDSGFVIPDVPPGSYQLAIWDNNLDVVFAAQPFTVDETGGTCNGGQSCDFGEVAVFNWFTRLTTAVFNDDNQNGFWDEGEAPVGPEGGPGALRWRDGTLYQEFATDGEGFAPFDEVFPFFHWMVAEVGFGNKKATGATFIVDAGGEVRPDGGWADPTFDELNPQPQCSPVAAGEQHDVVTSSADPRGTIGDCLTSTDSGATWSVDNARQIINPNTGNNLSWTEIGQVLTAATQGFLGQVSVIQFGKADYMTFTPFDFTSIPPSKFVGENGGISGIVYYATVRAEDEPQFTGWETWEPGVPRVQINLYADGDVDCFPQGDFPNSDCDIDWNQSGGLPEPDDGVIDDINGNGVVDLADVDNYPLGWAEGGARGPEDVDHDNDGVFDRGDAIAITWTDSWDDSLPTECQGANKLQLDLNSDGVIDGVDDNRCFDGLRNFNQVRPGVFDGGYAFNNYDTADLPAPIATKLGAFYADRVGINPNLPTEWMLPADYIVEAATPTGYKLVREHHKNVDFGDSYIPSTQALAPSCVGDVVEVKPILAMATKDGSGDLAQIIPGIDPADVAAPFYDPLAVPPVARPLCDRKSVPLSAAQNAAAEFFLMTDVPLMANASGVILNDLANEFNPNSPAFGEKFAPPNAPVGFYDAEGNEVNRVYADTFGRYNAVLPSTFTANLPMPSGQSPNMLVSCMNDAGTVPNPAYDIALDADGDGVDDNGNPAQIIDPFYNPQYSQFCYTFQYMPGVATYLDTPVEPIAAFAGPGQFPVDCERQDGTPMISYVKRRGARIGPFVLPGQQIRVQSRGNNVEVLNPEWDGVNPANKFVNRDFRFVAPNGANQVVIIAENGTETTLNRIGGNRNRIFAQVPAGVAPGNYQLLVRNTSSGTETPIGVTLTVGTLDAGIEVGVRANGATFNVWSVPGDFATIQEAIGDPTKGQPGVASGDMILVEPGIYDEMVIMWKPVKLQGWGANVTTINARQAPTEKIIAWRELAQTLDSLGLIDRLEGQQLGTLGFPGLGATLFPSEEGAGVFVVGRNSGPDRFVTAPNRGARIDGFTVTGASQGGGIVANGFNQFLNITNNRVQSNSGIFGGGVRIGHHNISHEISVETDYNVGGVDGNEVGDVVYDDARNDQVKIRYNHIAQNGNTNGTGGGISLHTGADAYRVQNNWVCGNFGKGDGGGIAHFGRSNGGVIEDNQVVFNEVFNQMVGTAPSGAGIFIGGQPALQPAGETGLMLSPGTGHVTVDSNLIRGNLAGAGDGAGIRIDTANGLDVDRSLGARGPWYDIFVFNNMITNNVAGVAGAISVSDSLQAIIRNNTVANNESTATGSQAISPTNPNLTVAQPAGIVSRLHGPVTEALVNINELEGIVYIDPTTLRRPEGELFSDPVLRDNIVFHNRSFYWTNYDDPATAFTETGLVPATCADPTDPLNDPSCDVTVVEVEDYTNDLGVLDGIVETGDVLDSRFSLLQIGEAVRFAGSNTFISTNTTIDAQGKPQPDPGLFVNSYFNSSRDGFTLPEFKTLATAAALDEGGNFIQVAFGPLSLNELNDTPNDPQGPEFDYHLEPGSLAINNGGPTPATGRLSVDFDNDPRPVPADASDIGADEL